MKILSKSVAKELVEDIRAGKPVNWEKHVREEGEPSGISEVQIHELQGKLAELRTRIGNPHARSAGAKFEAHASKITHQALRLTPTAVASSEFWIWLSVEHFSDLIEWRHSRGSGYANLANYGLENRFDGLMLRLWMRGEIGFDEKSASYDLASYGDQDFWRSHIFRQSFASCRVFARAFIKEVFSPNKGAPLTTAQIRELARRLRRLYATCAFEVMSPELAHKIISSEISKIHGARN